MAAEALLQKHMERNRTFAGDGGGSALAEQCGVVAHLFQHCQRRQRRLRLVQRRLDVLALQERLQRL